MEVEPDRGAERTRTCISFLSEGGGGGELSMSRAIFNYLDGKQLSYA